MVCDGSGGPIDSGAATMALQARGVALSSQAE